MKKSNLLDQSNQFEEDRDGGVEETHSRIPLLEESRSDVHVGKAGGSTDSNTVAIKEDRKERTYCDTGQGVEQGMSDLSMTGNVAVVTEELYKVEQVSRSKDHEELGDVTPARLTGSSERLETHSESSATSEQTLQPKQVSDEN